MLLFLLGLHNTAIIIMFLILFWDVLLQDTILEVNITQNQYFMFFLLYLPSMASTFG